MTRFSRFVIAVAVACLPLLAKAEGKCNDDPKRWHDPQANRDRLLVAWSIPVPVGAVEVKNWSENLLQKLQPAQGAPEWDSIALPANYGPPVQTEIVRTHPGAQAGEAGFARVGDLDQWLHAHFTLDLEAEARPILEQYVAKNSKVVGFVVEHPMLEDGGLGYRYCTCTLQRAAMVLRGQKQELWLQTRFQSARDSTNVVNFVPDRPVVFSFNVKKTGNQVSLWFPLALNYVLPLSGTPAFLRLDVLTNVKEKHTLAIPPGFDSVQRGTVEYDSGTWNVTRIWRRYDRSGPAADLFVDVK